MPATERPNSEPRRVKSVVNAMRVLRELGASHEPLRLSELSERLGLRKSTVHLLLSTLADFNFVQPHEQRGYYRLGLGAFEVGAAAVDALSLPPEVGPPMHALADRSLEAVSLAVRSGENVVIVRRYESAHILRAEIGVGTRMPLPASASGKCLLAAMTPEQIDTIYPTDELPGGVGSHSRSKRDLLQELGQVRRQGYASNKDEFVVGVSAIAAPVLDRHGRTAGSLSVAGPSFRFDEEKWVRPLLDTAAEISKVLGYEQHDST